MDNTTAWTPVDLLVSQLMEMYDPHDDAETIQETFSVLNSKRDELHHQENTLRDYLKELQKDVDEQEGAGELSCVIEEQTEQVTELNKQREEALQRLQAVRKDISSTEQDICKAEDEYLELVKRHSQAKNEENITKMKIKNVFVLYHELSKITWDYDSPNIKGVMSRMKFNDVIDFEISPEGKSDYEIANTLWDMMEGDEPTVL